MFQTARSVTPGQIRKLWVSAKSMGLSDADLHRLVLQVSGKESIRLLTCEEASRAIDQLTAARATPTDSPRPRRERHTPLPNNVIELATEKQIDLISRLLWHLGWGADDQYFRACVRQAIGRENIRTKREASDVIDMLRARVKGLGLEEEAAPSHRPPEGGVSGHDRVAQRECGSGDH
jgi:hypothetical protein